MKGLTCIECERIRFGLSQDDLADALEVSRQAICDWEKNPEAITGFRVVQLARTFGCTTDYLLGLTDKRNERLSTSSSKSIPHTEHDIIREDT